LLTRPTRGAELFAKAVKDRLGDAFEIVIAPLQRIEWLDAGPIDTPVGGLIFTSSNGVLGWNRDDSASMSPAFCVGPRTTATARKFGLNAIDCGGSAEDVVDSILSKNPPTTLVHYRGVHGRGEIATRLTEAGMETLEKIVYRQVQIPPTEKLNDVLSSGKTVVVPLFSPRSVDLFVKSLPEKSDPWLAIISPNAGKRVDVMLQRRMMVAKAPNADAMLDLVEDILNCTSAP